MTSTKAPVDEPEFGAASILEENENENKKGEVIEEDAKEQLGTIPLWVWILGNDFKPNLTLSLLRIMLEMYESYSMTQTELR